MGKPRSSGRRNGSQQGHESMNQGQNPPPPNKTRQIKCRSVYPIIMSGSSSQKVERRRNHASEECDNMYQSDAFLNDISSEDSQPESGRQRGFPYPRTRFGGLRRQQRKIQNVSKLLRNEARSRRRRRHAVKHTSGYCRLLRAALPWNIKWKTGMKNIKKKEKRITMLRLIRHWW